MEGCELYTRAGQEHEPRRLAFAFCPLPFDQAAVYLPSRVRLSRLTNEIVEHDSARDLAQPEHARGLEQRQTRPQHLSIRAQDERDEFCAFRLAVPAAWRAPTIASRSRPLPIAVAHERQTMPRGFAPKLLALTRRTSAVLAGSW
jgi:hypothetical protein